VFSVGGIQSSVAVPVEGLLDLTGGVEFVEVLSLDATVVVLELEVVPVAGVVVVATVVEPDVGVVPDTGVALCVVSATRSVLGVTTALGVPVSEVRSTTPMLGDTRLGIGSAAVDAVAELDPASAPQAARPNVRRPHNTTLRMCARTTKAEFFIDHYPGKALKTARQGLRYITHTHEPAAVRLRSE
jgi:hypothetical protein